MGCPRMEIRRLIHILRLLISINTPLMADWSMGLSTAVFITDCWGSNLVRPTNMKRSNLHWRFITMTTATTAPMSQRWMEQHHSSIFLLPKRMNPRRWDRKKRLMHMGRSFAATSPGNQLHLFLPVISLGREEKSF